jgi:hypothetical protein
VADLPARARDEDDRFSHALIIRGGFPELAPPFRLKAEATTDTLGQFGAPTARPGGAERGEGGPRATP